MAINGAHVIITSKDAEADKTFFRDVLRFAHVDAGHGGLIFKLPEAEAVRRVGGHGTERSRHAGPARAIA
jgi:hypothetical protein